MARSSGSVDVARLSKVIAGVGLAVALCSMSASAHAAVLPKLVFPAAGEANAIRNSALVVELDWGDVTSELGDGVFELRNDQGERLELGPFGIATTADGETTFAVTEPLQLAPKRRYTLSANLDYDPENGDVRRLDAPRVFAEFTTGEATDDSPPEITAVNTDDEPLPLGWGEGPPCDWRLEVATKDNATPGAWVGFRVDASWGGDEDEISHAVDDGLIVRIPGGQAAMAKGLRLIPVDLSGNEGESQVVNVPECPFVDNSEGPITWDDDTIASDAETTVDPASGCSISPATSGHGSSTHWFWTTTLSLGVLGWVLRRRIARPKLG